MTNKELSAQCLIEAAELLGESAGRNGIMDKYLATRELNKLKNGEGNDDVSDWYHGGREQRIKDLEKQDRTGKRYRHGKPEMRGKDYLDKRYERQRDAQVNDMSADINGQAALGKRGSIWLHDLINRNAELAEAKAKHKQALEDMPYKYQKLMRKSRNESVDIDALLEEAMDLLDY